MIHELRISNLGVIAEATCRFAPGFTAVTGETGAGKTMVVTGLGLLAGARADPTLVRADSELASVEGLFDPAGPRLAAVIEQAGGFADAEGLTAARLISTRARAVLAGRSVPAGLLAEVMAELLVIHGQHDQVRLGGKALALLDAWAGESTQLLAREVAGLVAQVRAVQREHAELSASAMARAREVDILEHGLAEISSVDPQSGEDLALAVEALRLTNAQDLAGAAREAGDALTCDVIAGGTDVLALLAQARRALEGVLAHDPALAGPIDAIRSISAQVNDVASDLHRYCEDIEADPGRLAAVQDRRAELGRLLRKYGHDIDEVLAWAAESAQTLSGLTGADDRIETLAHQGQQLRGELAVLCADLHEQRVAAADRFAAEVSTELAALAMPRARVEFHVSTSPDPQGIVLPGRSQAVAFGLSGVDEVVLMLAANPGAPMRPVSQAASGGELSRVMLAIQVVLAEADPVATMVFDEVDAGVGGAAAIEVGRRLRKLSERTQVIVVTHLAQVAAFADEHLVVTKDSDGVVTASSMGSVRGADRIRELSRMLGGLADSAAAGAHAQELMALAGHG